MEHRCVGRGLVRDAVPVALGVLVSGAGRSLANIHAAIERGELRARIALVAATRPGTPALERARALGLPTAVVPADPAHDFDDRLDEVLRHAGVELVCLAGYLRLFRAAGWAGRAVNIHPALLPRFGGAGMFGRHVHQAVLDSGERESGCTVHWVDEEYDRGEIILQSRCPVERDDTPETLAERVFALECTAYPDAISLAVERVRRASMTS